jgi:hypothetical protein
VGTAPVRRDAVALEPRGRALALSAGGETVIVDVAARAARPAGLGVELAAWSPNGRKAVLSTPAPTPESWGLATLLLLDLDTGAIGVLAANALYHSEMAQEPVSFSADGTRVLLLGNFGAVVFGELAPNFEGDLQVVDTRTLEVFTTPDVSGAFRNWRFSPDGGAVIYQREEGSLVYWVPARDRITPVGTAPVDAVAWSSRGDRLAFLDAGETCRLLRVGTDGDPGLYLVPNCEEIAFLPDGERTAVIVFDQDTAKRNVRLWSGGDLGPSRAVLPGQGYDPQVRFAPDGSAVLWRDSLEQGGTVVRVRGLAADTTGEFPASNGYGWTGFSPDGAFALAISGSLGELLALEVATGTLTRLDGPVPEASAHRDFALYSVADQEQGRGGWWLAHYPRTPAE